MWVYVQQFWNQLFIFQIILVPKIKNLDLPVENENSKVENDSKDVDMQVLSNYVEDQQLALLALDGFLLVLSADGDITFVSDNITDILGLSKVRHQLLFPTWL